MLLFQETLYGLIKQQGASAEFLGLTARLIIAYAGLQLPTNTHNHSVCVYGYRPGKRKNLKGMILLQINVDTNYFKLVFI